MLSSFMTVSIQHQKQLIPPSRDGIKLSLFCLRSLSILCHNLVNRDFDYLIIPHVYKLVYSTRMVFGEQEVAGTPEALLRYMHTREWEKHMKILRAYYLSNISGDPMCCGK